MLCPSGHKICGINKTTPPGAALYNAMLLLLMLMVGAGAGAGGAVGYDRSVNYWEAFAPGKLLQRLDALTLTADGQLPVEQPLLHAQAKLDEDADGEVAETDDDVDVELEEEEEENEHDDPADDVDIDAVDSSAETHSGEDYERNYEQFVRHYFDRVPEEDDDDDDDHEEHSAQVEDDSSIETQAEASNVQRQQKQKPKDRHKRQHCRRVQKQGQLCQICREPRNNEVSETCSYSHEAEPERYAYGSGSQYKRYRDQSSPDEEKEEEKGKVVVARPQRSERHTTVVQPNDDDKNSSSSSSLCVRRLQGKSICYECKDSAGKRMSRCYDAAIKTKRSHKKPRNNKQSKQAQEQRIYKRTISYSYAQDSRLDNPEEDNPEVTTTQSSLIASKPSAASTGRRFVKLLRRRTPIPHMTS